LKLLVKYFLENYNRNIASSMSIINAKTEHQTVSIFTFIFYDFFANTHEQTIKKGLSGWVVG